MGGANVRHLLVCVRTIFNSVSKTQFTPPLDNALNYRFIHIKKPNTLQKVFGYLQLINSSLTLSGNLIYSILLSLTKKSSCHRLYLLIDP